MIKKIRDYFLSGLLVLVPLGLTVVIIWQIFEKLDGLLKNLVAWIIRDVLDISWIPLPIPGLGIAAIILLILGAGMFARNIFGRKLIKWAERLLHVIPFVNRIYKAIQEIAKVFLSEKRGVFEKAVLIEYPRRGIYCIGFYTRPASGEISNKTQQELLSIFLPTTPNPTSGFLLLLPEKDVLFLDMSIEEAMKMVVSGGAVLPEGNATPVREMAQVENSPD